MNVLFDTSVLVSALVEELPNHEAALEALARYSRNPHRGMVSTHGLAECYATLTALPLRRRIQPSEAERMIAEGLQKKLVVLALTQTGYDRAIRLAASLGLVSGAIYDALHLICGIEGNCQRLFTYNLLHFQRFESHEIAVMTP